MSQLQVLLLALAVTLCSCEPPVPYNYQAPNSNYIPPSTSYGTPNSNYAAPSPSYQSNQYIPPVNNYNTNQNHGYQAQNHDYQAQNNGYQAQNHGYQAQNQGYADHGYNSVDNGYNSGDHGYNSGDHGYNGHDNHDHGHGHDNEVPKSYEFGYAVKDAHSGNDYDRHETSDGNTVRGEYRVQLPDGRTQIVTYHADWQTGFHADVRYEGEARYPEPTYNNNAQQGYNYNTPEFSGSLSGFQGNHAAYSTPAPSYGAPYH